MIVLDTNVVSELMRNAPDPGVLAWVDGQPADELYLTSVTAAELLHGVALLSPGRRREQLAQKVGRLIDEVFEGRVIPFDSVASVEYVRITGTSARAGAAISVADALIATTAAAVGADTFATRNVRDFSDTGLTVVNPWGS